MIAFAAAALLYVITCAPTILWQDSGLFVYRIWHNDIQGKLGIALSHPLYILIGIAVKNIPLGDMAHRINLISAISAALAVANLFLLLRLWLDRNLPAAIGAVTLAVSWTFWQHSVIAESYTLYIAQMLGQLIVLLLYIKTKRTPYLFLLGLLNGLAIANHLWALFGFACYAVFLMALFTRKRIRLRYLLPVILLWLIGATPYLYLIVRSISATGDIRGTIASALFGNEWQGQVLNASLTVKIILENLIFILLNFPTPNLILFFVGLWVLRKTAPSRAFANIITAMLILHLLFAFRYTVPDRYSFFLPFYCFVAILTGLGADALLKKANGRKTVIVLLAFSLLPVVAYFFTPKLARKYYKPLVQRRQRPYRDEYAYFLQPWKTGYRGAERFANEALDTVEQNAIIYAPFTDVHALLYVQQVKGKRSDIRIVSDFDMSENAPILNADTIGDLMKEHPLYVVSTTPRYCPAFILDKYDFEPAEVVWKVVDK